MIGAGDLNARVRFDQRGLDANGDALGEFEDGFTVWAKVEYLRGSESAVASRLAKVQPAIMVIRDSSRSREITNAYRAVVISGRSSRPGEVFNITAVAPDKTPGFMNIMATSGGAAG